ncbi:MAG: AMP-binding protein [Parahaliea sp.]
MNIQRAHRNTLSDAFQRAARNYAQRKALSFYGRCWTYSELNNAVQRISRNFLDMGLKSGDRLATYGRNSDVYVMTFLACARIGVVHVPVNYALVEKELLYVIKQSGAKAVFSDPGMIENIEKIRNQCDVEILGRLFGSIDTDLLEVAQGDHSPGLPEIDMASGDCVQLMYTSGTTSNPKGAMMTHECLLAEYQSAIIHLDIKASDVSLAALPLYHTAQMC